jgi:hypothetical protein
MLRTALIEDVNRIGCAALLEGLRADPARARDALDRMRWIDLSELDRFGRAGWLTRGELELIESFAAFARERLRPAPEGRDPVDFARCDPGWHLVRERAVELLEALDAFVDLGVPGWGVGRVGARR